MCMYHRYECKPYKQPSCHWTKQCRNIPKSKHQVLAHSGNDFSRMIEGVCFIDSSQQQCKGNAIRFIISNNTKYVRTSNVKYWYLEKGSFPRTTVAYIDRSFRFWRTSVRISYFAGWPTFHVSYSILLKGLASKHVRFLQIVQKRLGSLPLFLFFPCLWPPLPCSTGLSAIEARTIGKHIILKYI